MNVLVLGGSGTGYGGTIANRLRSQRYRNKPVHQVWTLQRKCPGGSDADPSLLDRWFQCDLREAESTVVVIRKLIEDSIRLDAVLNFAAFRDRESVPLVNSYDVSAHIGANVLNPLFMVRWMVEYGVLQPNARVVFPLDRRKFTSDDLAFAMSKSVVIPLIRTFSGVMDGSVKFSMPYLPEKDSVDADAAIEELIRRLMSDEPYETGVIDLLAG